MRIYTNNADKEGVSGGFTLVELIVAMFVFTAAITLAVGIFISGLQAERRLVAEISGNNAVASALEIMTREIRVGYDFVVSGVSNNELSFVKSEKKSAKYGLLNGAILRNDQKITGENVSVEYLEFKFVQKDNNGNDNNCSPWRVTIVMGVKPKNSDIVSKIQTTASSRVLPGDLEKYPDCRID